MTKITLSKEDIINIKQLLDSFPDVDDVTISVDNSSGIHEGDKGTNLRTCHPSVVTHNELDLLRHSFWQSKALLFEPQCTA